ncbi:hypothetical protein C0993_008726 [Termitomyces sp. T159_Od127]|nr:hypothetical protein C0993_008726 [Termitomyces sp. T159_Od127]
MFPRALRAALIALLASAVAVSALPSLSVKVSGEPAVTNVDKLVVRTTVTNTGHEILTLLNHPESPLNKLPANTFAITDASGDTPAFTGIKAKYVPSRAIAAGKDAVTVLAPGQSIEVEHNRKSIYRLTSQISYNTKHSVKCPRPMLLISWANTTLSPITDSISSMPKKKQSLSMPQVMPTLPYSPASCLFAAPPK